ncbi:MAG: hypothetical protein KGL39_03770 [Patescibacteria group bacterium]|nr:hypothetical protein [Patescibacteria group bacterium]
MPEFPRNSAISLKIADLIVTHCRRMGVQYWHMLSETNYGISREEFERFVRRNWAHIFPDTPRAA